MFPRAVVLREPHYRLNGNVAYRSFGHPEGPSSVPWFVVRGRTVYPGEGYPGGATERPLYRVEHLRKRDIGVTIRRHAARRRGRGHQDGAVPARARRPAPDPGCLCPSCRRGGFGTQPARLQERFFGHGHAAAKGPDHVNDRAINVRYSERMDFRTPVETMIPGATGRLLAALARVDTELPVSTLARVAGVGRTRASGLVAELSSLGLVDRREIGRTTMVRLARDNAAGQLVDRLGQLQSVVVDQLRLMATELDPAPLSLLVFGSFARGEATSDSDIDVLAVRPTDVDSDRWADAVATFATKARRLTGNPVQVLDYDLDELRRRAGPRAKTGRAFWEALRRDSLVLAGTSVGELLTDTHVPSR